MLVLRPTGSQMSNRYCLQETARKHKGWTLDTVRLDNEVLGCFMEDVGEPPLEGVYVHGLVLDSATWDLNSSHITDAKQQVTSLFHLLHIIDLHVTLSWTVLQVHDSGYSEICHMTLS